MRPEGFRRRLGFALGGAAPLSLMTAAPALAQGFSPTMIANAAPIAIGLGIGAFALLGFLLLRRALADNGAALRRASEQTASLRALVDDYAGKREARKN